MGYSIKLYLALLCLSFPCYCFFSAHYGAAQKSIPTNQFERYVAISKSSRAFTAIEAADRKGKNGNTLKAIRPEIEASEEIWGLLTDCTAGKTLEESIHHCLHKLCDVEVASLRCVDPDLIDVGEAVFIAKDEGLVVKVFMHKAKFLHRIAKEISGMAEMQNLKLQHGQLVDFLALGKCTVNGKGYYLLVETLAPGMLVHKSIEDIFSASDRSFATLTCKKGMRLLGQALGELHAKKALKVALTDEVWQLTVANYQSKIKQAIEEFRLAGGPCLGEVEALFARLMQQCDVSTVYYAVHHGDAHLGNFLYDDKTETIYVIDTPRVHRTIDQQGVPISPDYVSDLANVEEDIARWVLLHEYNEPLIQELIASFYEGYMQEAKELVIPSQIKLRLALDLLRRWRLNLNGDAEPDVIKQAQQKRLAERSREVLLNN